MGGNVDFATAAALAAILSVLVLLLILLRALRRRYQADRTGRQLRDLVAALDDNLTGLTLDQATKAEDAIKELQQHNQPDLAMVLDVLSSGAVQRQEARNTLQRIRQELDQTSHGLDLSAFLVSTALTVASSSLGFVATFLFSSTNAPSCPSTPGYVAHLQNLFNSLRNFILVGHTSIGVLVVAALGAALLTTIVGFLVVAVYSLVTAFKGNQDPSVAQRFRQLIAYVALALFLLLYTVTALALVLGLLSS